jgi:hypothetical protein
LFFRLQLTLGSLLITILRSVLEILIDILL